MAGYESSSTNSSARNKKICSKLPCTLCNCDWELKVAHGLAFSLAVLEAKRLFLLALEMLVEFAVLQFSGGIKPLIFSFVDVFLGFPCALVAVYSIRKRQKKPCYSKVKMLLKCVGLLIVICAILNMATLASIGYHVSVRQRTVINVFNTSMHLYVTTESYKCNLDEIQIEFQCCGHTSYADWFRFDWQRVDYTQREAMGLQPRISDEGFRDRGVPFSCCNFHSMLPCIHIQMSEADVKTINAHGCSKILSQALIRIVVFGYIMTSMLIITQGILLYFIVKISSRPLPQDCPSDCSHLSSEDSSPRFTLMEPSSLCSCSSSSESLSVGDERPLQVPTRHSKIIQTSRKSSLNSRNSRYEKRKNSRTQLSTSSSSLSDRSCIEPLKKSVTARIRPSTHKQHQISREQFSKNPVH